MNRLVLSLCLGLLATGAVSTASHARPQTTSVALPDISEEEAKARIKEIQGLLRQADQFMAAGQYPKAIAPAEAALTTSDTYLGEGPYSALILGQLGVIYASNGQFDKAEKGYLRGLGIVDRVEAVNVDMTGQKDSLCSKLGILYAYTQRPAQAEPYLQRALDLRTDDKLFNDDYQERMIVLKSLADIYDKGGKTNQAASLRARAEAIRTHLGNPGSSH